MPRFKHPELAKVYHEVLVQEHGVDPERATRILRVAGPFSEQAVQWAEFLARLSARHNLDGHLFRMLAEAQWNGRKRRRLFSVLRQGGARLLPLDITEFELPWILEGAIEALRPPTIN